MAFVKGKIAPVLGTMPRRKVDSMGVELHTFWALLRVCDKGHSGIGL
jgi:hypothetical protein